MVEPPQRVAEPSAAPYQPGAILLTGGLGFIGSHVAHALHQAFPLVPLIIYDRQDYCSRQEYVSNLLHQKNVKLVKGDLCSRDCLREVMVSNQIDTVLHLAAQSHVDLSFQNSHEFVQSNIVGTHTLVDVCRELGSQVRRFVHTSTDEVYGDSEDHGADHACTEHETVMTPRNPYSASKAAGELIVRSFMSSYKLPAVIVRPNNIMGPHQYPDKVIPRFTLLLNEGQHLTVHGQGEQRRSFLFVKDAARGFLRLLRYGQVGEIYNMGTDDEFSVKEVAEELKHVFEEQGKDVSCSLIQYVQDRPFQDHRYLIDSSKLHKLGWRPTTSFKDALRETVSWYQQNTHLYPDVQLSQHVPNAQACFKNLTRTT